MQKRIFFFGCATILLLLLIQLAHSQTTELTYQGSLKNTGVPANGNYDFEFLLFDSLSGGTQIASTLSVAGVTVANGLFSIRLNFIPGVPFTGENRYLEVRVRPTGQGSMTTLSPRQLVTSAPYAIRSGNAGFATVASQRRPSAELEKFG